MAERRRRRSDPAEDRPIRDTENRAIVAVESDQDSAGERNEKKEKKRAGYRIPNPGWGAWKAEREASKLPVADGEHAVGQRSIPIQLSDRERRNLWGRLATLFLVAVVLVLAVLIFVARPVSYTEQTHSVVFLYVPQRDATVVVVDGDVEGDKNGYAGMLSYRADSGKGNACAAIIGGSLYAVDGDDVYKLGDNVADCVLSANGSHVAWRDAEGSLYYAEVDDPENYRCASERASGTQYCLSPDGQELLYTHTDYDGISRMTLISLSGNSLIFGEDQDLTPVAVSDNSEYLYYTDKTGALYVLNGDSGAKILCAETPSELVFNADFSELLLRNGTETRLFIEGARFGINGLGGTDRLELQPNRRATVLPTYLGHHCLVNSLVDQYYICQTKTDTEARVTTKLIYLTEDDDRGEMTEVAYGVENVTVTDKYVFFMQTVTSPDTHTELFCAEIGEEESELCYGYVSDYRTNVDGSRLTYITQTGLYSGSAGKMLAWLSDYVVRERGVEVTCDDAFYYFGKMGELYVSDNGESARLLADGVDWFVVAGDTVYYGIGFDDDGIGAVCANFRNSRKSDLLLDGVGGIG
ncbi:MAG: hypothetical protein IJY22_00590 [Clostridia bacterium]|nr:hypothetical protein [Clostridia bacterium]